MSKIEDHQLPFDDLNNQLIINCDERDEENGNASHKYDIRYEEGDASYVAGYLQFHHGPRDEDSATAGCTDQAVLAVLLDRYRGFQSGPLSCRENAIVITKLEEALMWMQRRAYERHKRGVLGKLEK